MKTKSPKKSSGIGTLNEKPLHEDLKQWYAGPLDEFEVPFEGFVIDILHDGLAVEIQTRNFNAIARKLNHLLALREVRLVYPIAQDKWITNIATEVDTPPTRRKSPRHGRPESMFDELVSIPTILEHPNFSLELLLIQEEEVRLYDGVRGWRRGGWVTHERRLLEVTGRRLLRSPADLARFVPDELQEPFATRDLATAINVPLRLAQKMAYCLKLTGCIVPAGKQANAILYIRSPAWGASGAAFCAPVAPP